eukprot:6308092-Alexandrium_andersonii.AAC.1
MHERQALQRWLGGWAWSGPAPFDPPPWQGACGPECRTAPQRGGRKRAGLSPRGGGLLRACHVRRVHLR